VDSWATIHLPALNIPKIEQATPKIDVSSSASLSDEDLLTRVCEGNTEAISHLFRRHARVIRGIAYRVLRDPAEADDLLQDVFLLIHRLCGTFDASKGSARHWILQMTYRRAISRRRYLTSRHFYSNITLDDVAARLAGSDTSGPFENTLQANFGTNEKDLEEIFQELSHDQRKALLLRFVEGYTLPEIAEKLGQSKANIKNHYFRGLEKLRKHLFSGKLASKRAL
jgi:RNA polymerase sigma-70 factor (ECF subfamily)